LALFGSAGEVGDRTLDLGEAEPLGIGQDSVGRAWEVRSGSFVLQASDMPSSQSNAKAGINSGLPPKACPGKARRGAGVRVYGSL